MKIDDSHNSMREYIHYDFTSSFALRWPEKSDMYEDRQNKAMHEWHKKHTVDVWEGIV